jgi:predicted permease
MALLDLTAFLNRLRALFRRTRLDRDLDDELAFHLAMRKDEQARKGVAFGNVLQVKEQAREAWAFASIEAVLRDVQFACRSWRRSPGSALVAIATLACGIAVANTTFAIVNGALIRGLPFATPERLVHLGFKPPRADYGSVSFAEFCDLQVVRSLRLAAYAAASLTIADEDHVPERLQGTYVSAYGFDMLGIEAIAGRGVLVDDDEPGAAAVSVISEAVWKSRYGGDPTVVGRSVRVNGRLSTIIGVVPTRYTLTATRTDIWLPLMQLPDLNRQERAVRSLSVLGELTDGHSLNDARQELQAITSRFRQEHPEAYKEIEPITISLWDRFVHPQVQQILLVLFAAGLLVLLIACANVANLLLAQAASRQHEIATRVALGASRWQIWQQLLIECLLLGILSGMTALWISYAWVRLFASVIAATDPPVWLQFQLDWNVFVFLVAVALASSLGAALLPALQATRQDAHDGLQQARRSTTPSMRARRWSMALVAVEVALTLVLLSGAGLMMRSFWSLFRIDPGVEAGGLTVMRVDLAAPKYEGVGQRASLYDDLAERLSAKPMVPAVSVTTSLPGAGPPPQWTFQGEGEPVDPDHPALVSMAAIGDDYFQTLSRPLLGGRSFERFDGTPAREVAIVNERLVSLLFSSESPLGRRIRITRAGRTALDSGWMTIVGIAPTINQTNPLLGRGPDPVVYVPYRSRPAADAVLLARGTDTGLVVQQVRTELAALDPDLAVFDVQSLDTFLAFFRWPQRVFGTVLLALAAIALVLATVALYAIVAYAVVQRRQEIGVRVALGAQRRQILFLMLRSSAIPFVGGLLAGAGGVTAVGQLLEAFLVDTHPRDPATLLGVAALLCAVALIACIVPAQRAARLDPLVALRCE